MRRSHRTTRLAGLASLTTLLALAAAWAPPAGAQPPRVRKSIDALSSTELADYLHAVTTIKEISRRNPTSKDGYDYFAALHNSLSVGPCEHASDTFLPWHRAHLLEYEDALRRSDPPRTANVTIPFWNWSVNPSGRRYPKPFEDPSSVLFSPGRYTTPICPTGAPNCENLPWPWSYLQNEVLSVKPWFGTGPDHFGGVSNGALECRPRPGQGYGAPEQPSHNDMHSIYIGGFISSPSTAARDPIFYSFHAFYDLLFDRWQQTAGHKVDTCLACKLCGLQRKTGTGTVPWTVQDTLDAAGLGYRYDFTPPRAAPQALAAAPTGRPFPPFAAVDFALAGRRPAAVVHTREVVVPRTVAGPVRLRFQGVPVPDRFSYQGNVYLHPKDAEFEPREGDFHELYLVDLYSIWQGHAPDEGHEGHGAEDHGPREVTIAVDLTAELQALATDHAGETWHLTVALVPVDLGATSLRSFAAEVLPADRSFAEEIAFDSMDLEGLR